MFHVKQKVWWLSKTRFPGDVNKYLLVYDVYWASREIVTNSYIISTSGIAIRNTININWYMIFIGLQEFCLDDYQLYINDGTYSIDKFNRQNRKAVPLILPCYRVQGFYNQLKFGG